MKRKSKPGLPSREKGPQAGSPLGKGMAEIPPWSSWVEV